jgi:outer membrane biogenesis lipoprotein LolB
MRRKLISLPILALALLAQACSDKGASTPANETAQVTQTRMNEIDNLEGTISDEMIITDDSNDEAELESANDAKSDAPKTLPGEPKTEPAIPKLEDDTDDTAQ